MRSSVAGVQQTHMLCSAEACAMPSCVVPPKPLVNKRPSAELACFIPCPPLLPRRPCAWTTTPSPVTTSTTLMHVRSLPS